MTYVTEQTSQELRAHMRRLQAMAGWHNPLDDRLYKELLQQDAEIKQLRAALVAHAKGADHVEDSLGMAPLSNERIAQILGCYHTGRTKADFDFARAIEAAHGIAIQPVQPQIEGEA